MNAPTDLDLSGRWTGMFNYPGPFPPVAFEAELRDLGGSLAGAVLEPDENPQGSAGTLHSIIEGSRNGSAVTFTKLYEDVERMPEPVFYSGTVQPDGNEISGRWEITDAWSGTFLMIRDSGVAEAAEAQAGEELPIPDA